jgi:hypothetical protein
MAAATAGNMCEACRAHASGQPLPQHVYVYPLQQQQ